MQVDCQDFLCTSWYKLCQKLAASLQISSCIKSDFHRFCDCVYGFLNGAVSYFTHIFFSFFLALLQTSYGFSLIKTYKLHYFYLILYSETTDRSEITVTTTFTSGLDLCIFPCFKYIVYQINSFALIAKWFPSIFIILVLFFARNYRVSHHAHPRLRALSWILNLKTLAQRFQVCYAQKHMRKIWHCSFLTSHFTCAGIH